VETLQRWGAADIAAPPAWYVRASRMTERLLMIEDDVRLAAMVREYLAEHGFEVEVAHDAASGLARLADDGFDALVLDVMLPDLDGFEVLRRVRAERALPVVMLTARGDDLDRIVGLELGADDYLPKPFNPRELLARLRAVLRRSRGAEAGRSAPLRVAGLVIEPEHRRVTRGGEPCELTSHQFELLWVLASRAGRPVSREALMEAVRGDALGPYDRSIDVHVSRIRAAIEQDPRHPRRLLTLRGVGYQLVREDPDEGSDALEDAGEDAT